MIEKIVGFVGALVLSAEICSTGIISRKFVKRFGQLRLC
jgi:hypothetical protein